MQYTGGPDLIVIRNYPAGLIWPPGLEFDTCDLHGIHDIYLLLSQYSHYSQLSLNAPFSLVDSDPSAEPILHNPGEKCELSLI